MIEVIVYFLIMATALPTGWLLSWLCDDELLKDRKYFIWFAYFIMGISLLLMLFYFSIPILLSLAYLLIVLAILVNSGKRIKTRKMLFSYLACFNSQKEKAFPRKTMFFGALKI